MATQLPPVNIKPPPPSPRSRSGLRGKVRKGKRGQKTNTTPATAQSTGGGAFAAAKAGLSVHQTVSPRRKLMGTNKKEHARKGFPPNRAKLSPKRRRARHPKQPPPVSALEEEVVVDDDLLMDQATAQLSAVDIEPKPAQPAVVNRQSLCIDTLVSGNVDSFVDFFYLTHSAQSSAGNVGADDDKRAAGDNGFSRSDLLFLKKHLTTAEEANRTGDPSTVFSSYEKLAEYFRQLHEASAASIAAPASNASGASSSSSASTAKGGLSARVHVDLQPVPSLLVATGEFKTAVYFFEKCREIAERHDDIAQQARANLHLGLIHSTLGPMYIQRAIAFHEKHFELTQQLNNGPLLEDARHHLVEVYRRSAEMCERAGDTKAAVKAYNRCLDTASQSSDLATEGKATYRLGIAYGRLGDLQQARKCHERYLHICRETKDQLGEGAACAALAQTFKKLNEHAVAIKYLENFLQLAKTNGQHSAIVEACTALGSIYSLEDDHRSAVKYYDKAFQIAVQIKDKSLIDTARVNLGMARGNVAMPKYMKVVNGNLEELLSWKTRRTANFSRKT